MGFFDRLANVWKGFLSLWISEVETKNPEAVYEAAIEERVRKHKELKKAVSGIVYLRNKLAAELEAKEKELAEVQVQIPIAVEEGEDEVALVLIQRKDELSARIAELQVELEKVAAQTEEAKSGLIAFQEEIKKLQREKEEMLAKKANAEARITIQETLDGLSTDADIKALDNVRTHIDKLQAEADVATEIKGESLDDKLAKIKAKTSSAAANAQLEELKKQMAARKAAQAQAAGAAGVKKTM
ncbi:MAG: PspA/IM30 family protein [Alphaproteobacteria bacterium]|nr:PspA/IM30 family protein [Alphaproteobacteria bacterium]MCB9794529.1 PspA/IM30 family protein [Alphaproteobacteria bacterium]